MPETVIFEDPTGDGPPIELTRFEVPKNLPDRSQRIGKIPEPDPHYVDVGMLYRFAQVEAVRRAEPPGFVPLHVAVRGHMGTGKDHDVEQFAAKLGLPYFRIPLTGEVRDVTLIGSTKLHGDGAGGTESRWEDGDITRALRGPALLNLSELNAAGAETLFALHGLLDRYAAIDLPNGETVRLRDDVRVFGTMNPTDLRDYAGTQTLNKAFADRWVIWEKRFPGADQIEAMLRRRYPDLREAYVQAIARLALSQAEHIARYSVTLLPAQRRAILNRLIEAYQASDDAKTAQTLRSNLDTYSVGPGVSLAAAQQLLPTLRGGVVLPSTVTAALAGRQAAAAGLAARWLSAGSGDRQTLVDALTQALLAEDAARAEFYAGASTLALPERLALLHDQVAWLTIKQRAASGAYGVALAPDWANQADAISTALTDTYTELINGYGQQLDTLDAVEGLTARVELLRQGVLWARLGILPEHVETALSEQLSDASRQLWTRQGNAGLLITPQDVRGQRLYLLAGSDAAQK